MFLTPYPNRKSRKNGFIKPLQALEGSTLPVQQTLRTAKLFIDIQQSLRDFLQQNIGNHCHILKLADNHLELAVPNAAVASKLRQFAPSIAKHLNQHGYAIQHIGIKVRATLNNPPSKTAKPNPRHLSRCHQAYQELLEKDPHGPLADTLRRILNK